MLYFQNKLLNNKILIPLKSKFEFIFSIFLYSDLMHYAFST